MPIHACIQSILEAAKGLDKPLVVAMITLPELSSSAYQLLSESGIPTYADTKRAAFALTKLADYAEFLAGS